MKKILKWVTGFLFIGLVTGCQISVTSTTADLTITNNTGGPIDVIFVADPLDVSWGTDQLSSGDVLNGADFTILDVTLCDQNVDIRIEDTISGGGPYAWEATVYLPCGQASTISMDALDSVTY